MQAPQIDRVNFTIALFVVLLVGLPLLIWPSAAGALILQIYNWIAEHFGLAYQWGVIGITIFLAWLAFSPYGKIKLGGAGAEPEFSTFSWFGMLFSAGVGAGLLYWAPIEWAFYFADPPFGAEPRSVAAYQWATSYGLFHWGIAAWAIYALPTIAFAYPDYTQKSHHLRLRTAFHGMLAQNNMSQETQDTPHTPQNILSRLLDFLFMLALLAGAGTSMGLAIPMVSDCIALLFDIERSKMLDMSVVLICVALFALSVYWGLEKGIRKLADLNVILAILFLIAVLCIGPTLFILRLGTESIGFMFANFISMLTYTESLERTPFVEDWTIFYWAWWFAYAPFIGLFIARISRGRSLRQVIFSMCFLGSLGAWSFFLILGNYALHLDTQMILDVTSMVQADPPRAIAEILATLPLRQLMLGIFILLSIIFIATTYDSASYSLASAASRNLAIGSNPARWHRMFWAFVLGFLPFAVLSVSGGIKTAKSLVLVASLPILIICVIMCFSLLKSLRHARPQ